MYVQCIVGTTIKFTSVEIFITVITVVTSTRASSCRRENIKVRPFRTNFRLHVYIIKLHVGSTYINFCYKTITEGVYLYTRIYGKVFSLARLKAKTKTLRVLTRKMLFIYPMLHWLLTQRKAFRNEWTDSPMLVKNVDWQVVSNRRTLWVRMSKHHIDNMTLDVVDHFTHIDSTITSNLFIDTEINMRVAKAAAVMFKLDKGATQRRHKTRKF